ncbi:hypothetical protein BLL42_27250 (plasmid) [Pseudomonas frederiksbergensis]|uniref:EAL domain-containing protein n=1 Tax=Pseudomonas frederiksbergensis TaxID=104087 RepID=A0A1J0ETW6_9PSED|nr:EAL domain-containing protein [Pseudomonas frederiksbergensis]APC19438.1 hypothetical protein BLL42_27250 [Pseudomonas frederiksbergensis]
MTLKLAVQGLHAWSSLQGYEVLARKVEPEGQILVPHEFVLPERGLSWCELDSLVLGLANSSDFLRNTSVPIFINLSAATLRNEILLARAANQLQVLREWVSNDVVLEVSEKYYASKEVMAHQVTHLRSLGIKLAIDDFGYEHSDIERLKLVHWDYCKIDLTALRLSENLEWLYEAYQYCTSDGVQMVLERYEQPRPCEVINSLKGAWIQGFSLSKPMLIDTPVGSN